MSATPKRPDASEESLLRVAYSCYEGMKEIAKNFHSHTIIPFGILSGHCIEAFLKCHLLQKGMPHDRVRALGHNLEAAWAEAAKAGPPIHGAAPHWVVALNAGHDRPYMFRYLPHLHGVGCASPEDFMDKIPPILESLRKTCGYII